MIRFVLPLVLAACAGGQSPECEAYMACLEAVDQQNGGDTTAALESTYGEDGSCWKADPATAASCDLGCEAGLDTLQGSVDPLPSECE
jgi:hypothetical protein